MAQHSHWCQVRGHLLHTLTVEHSTVIGVDRFAAQILDDRSFPLGESLFEILLHIPEFLALVGIENLQAPPLCAAERAVVKQRSECPSSRLRLSSRWAEAIREHCASHSTRLQCKSEAAFCVTF